MKRLARSQRPASARKIARSGDRENKAPGRVEVGFKTLLSQNQMSKRGGEKNAPKKVKNGKADRVDTLRNDDFRSEKLRHKQVFDYNEVWLADKQSGTRRKHHECAHEHGETKAKRAKK